MSVHRSFSVEKTTNNKNKHQGKRKVTTTLGEKKQSFFTNRTNFSSVSPEALSEMSNVGLIYVLGGQPTYIHSTKVYFENGLVTANHKMQQILAQIANKQRQTLASKSAWIDQAWVVKMKRLGFDASSGAEAFLQFKKMWEQNPEEGDELFFILHMLEDLKSNIVAQKVIDSTITSLKQQVKSELGHNYATTQGADRLNDLLHGSLPMIDFSVSPTNRGKGGLSVTNSITADTQQKIDAIINLLKSSPKTNIEDLIAAMPSKIHKHIKQGGNIDSIRPFDDSQLGTLLETLSDIVTQLFDTYVESMAGEKLLVDITSVASDSSLNKSRQSRGLKYVISENNKIDKTDTIIALGEARINFPSSDKFKQSVEYMHKNANNKHIALIAEKWGADIASAHLNLQIQENAGVDETTQQHFTALANYVYKNFAAFPHITSTPTAMDFKEQLIAIFAWAQVINKTIGTPTDPSRIPLMVRSATHVYNMADILRTLSTMSDLGIIKGTLNYEQLQNGFMTKGLQYKQTPKDNGWIEFTMPYNEKHNLRFFKHYIIDKYMSKEKVTYKSLYKNSQFQDLLSSLSVNKMGTKQGSVNLPALNASYSITIGNLIKQIL